MYTGHRDFAEGQRRAVHIDNDDGNQYVYDVASQTRPLSVPAPRSLRIGAAAQRRNPSGAETAAMLGLM